MGLHVLTFKQPLAEMIAVGAKSYSFTMKCPGREKWGKKIGIHASSTMGSMRMIKGLITTLEEHGPGVLGIKDLKMAREIIQRALDDPRSFDTGKIIAYGKMRNPVKVRDIVKDGNIHGFNMDLWALPFTGVVKLARAVPAKGHPTIWWFDGDLRKRNGRN